MIYSKLTHSEKKWFLDVGNSKAKLVSLYENHWKLEGELPKSEYAFISTWIERFVFSKEMLWVASVIQSVNDQLTNNLRVSFHLIDRSKVPLEKLAYHTPETLGIDRYLACLGAYATSCKAVIVIDAGTALTVDAMDEQGIFQGGVIAPGLALFEKSLQQHAPALPSVERELLKSWPPKSTKEALKWGISGGFFSMIQGFVRQWQEIYPNADIWCTGGDGEWVSRQFKGVHCDPFLVQKGMLHLVHE